jgi:hypothetical protein
MSSPVVGSAARPALSQTVNAALPIMVLLPFVALLALVMRGGIVSPRFSAAAMFAGLTVPVLLGFVALTRRRFPRAGVVAALHALAWTPAIGLLCAQELGGTIVASPSNGLRCGTGLMMFVFVAAPVIAVVLELGGYALGRLFARRGTDGALRVGAFGGVALALIAFAFAAARLGRPDADSYLASLATVADLAPGGDVVFAGRTLRTRVVPVVEPAAVVDPSTGDVKVAAPSHVECQLTGIGTMEVLPMVRSACPRARIRSDGRGDLAVLELDGVDAFPWARSVFLAFDPRTGATVGITPRSIADRTAPPLGWTIGAGIGSLFGLALLLVGRRVRRDAEGLTGVQADHIGAGLVRLPTGEVVTVEAAAPLPVGRVLLVEQADHAPTYRAPGSPTFGAAFAGTLAVLRADRADRASSLTAVGLAVAALGATPLVVARVLGGL